MKLSLDVIAKYVSRRNDPEFLLAIDRNFTKIRAQVDRLREVQHLFLNATTGAVTYTLPSGSETDQDYLFIKTDASANAVTIAAAPGDTINGLATKVLTTQYAKVLLSYNNGIWFIVST